MKSTTFSNSVRRVFLSAIAASSLFTASQAFGQVNGAGPSESIFFNTIINIPEDEVVFRGQVIGGVFNRTTQLNLSDGGTINGGQLVLDFGTEANISGGTVTELFTRPDSELNVTGGTFGLLSVGRDNQTNISGGTFDGDFETFADSQLNISGGSFGDGVLVRADSNITLVGGEFSLNGTAYNDSTISLSEGDTFTGVFEDGSAFVFSDFLGDSIAADINLSTTAVPISTTTNFVIDSLDPDGAPLSLRSGQTLSVVEGGSLTNILESVGATINVSGGSLSRITTSQSSIDLSEGAINTLSVLTNGQLNVSGGRTGNILLSSSDATISGIDTAVGLITADASQLDVRDADLSRGFTVNDSIVNLSGNTSLASSFRATNSEVNISDDATLRNITSGIFFSNIEDSELNISGGTISFGLDVSRSTIDLSGGALENLRTFDSQVTIAGSSIGNGSTSFVDSETTLSDGSLGDSVRVTGGTLNILGGRIGEGLNVNIFDIPGTAPAATINVSGGVIGRLFRIESSGVANLSGGTIGNEFSVGPRPFDSDELRGGTANISGSVIGNDMFVGRGGVVNISGGQIGNNFTANSESVVGISGGQIGSDFEANDGSIVNISDGTLGSSFEAFPGSEVNISGGRFGQDFTTAFGSAVTISGGNFGSGFRGLGPGVELQGGEFRLNGFDISALSSISILGDAVFTGTLADGSNFIFSNNSGDFISNITLTTVELPAADVTPIVVDAPFSDLPVGLRTGQTLTLVDGGELGDNFEAVNAVVNIEGGTIGDNFGAAGTTVTIDGGNIGTAFVSYAGSAVNLNDGTIGDDFNAASGSEVFVSGGRIGQGFEASSGSIVRINGGTIGRGFEVAAGSDVQLSGAKFQLNGEIFNEPAISLAAGDVFTGTLEDGSAFIFATEIGDSLNNVQLNRTAVPAVDSTPLVVNSSSPDAPNSLQSKQTLTLEQGGIISGEFETIGAVLNISGGVFEDETAFFNTTVNLSDGRLGGNVAAFAGSELNLFGGTINGLIAASGSQINLHGSNIENRLQVNAGSNIDVFATEFLINGNEVEFADFDTPLLITNRNFQLSGTFVDGSPFRYFVGSSSAGDLRVSSDAVLQLNLTDAIPDPMALLGDVNLDGVVDFLDIVPFVSLLSAGDFQAEADIDQNGEVNFLDISPFVELLSGSQDGE